MGTKLCVRARGALYRMRRKLEDRRGASDFIAFLVLALIGVVVGGILAALFTDTIKEVWKSIQERIMDLFNYS